MEYYSASDRKDNSLGEEAVIFSLAFPWLSDEIAFEFITCLFLIIENGSRLGKIYFSENNKLYPAFCTKD
jgi:hypothetical protein